MSDEHFFVSSLKIGDSFAGIYYVESVQIRKTSKGGDFTDAVIRDKTGRVSIKQWASPKTGIEKGIYAYVEGAVQEYAGKPSIVVHTFNPAEKPSDLTDYIAVSEGVEYTVVRFNTFLEAVKNGAPTVAAVVADVFGNAAFMEKFVSAPDGVNPHYGKVGGLVSHVTRLCEVCERMVKDYALDETESSVLLGAVLLCRIGAVEAFEFVDCMPVTTKKGYLLGVCNLSMSRTTVALRRASGETNGKFDSELAVRLLHAVASCEGGIPPQTKEAVSLNAACRVDTEVVNAMDFIAADQNENDEFTAFDGLTQRRFYKGLKKS